MSRVTIEREPYARPPVPPRRGDAAVIVDTIDAADAAALDRLRTELEAEGDDVQLDGLALIGVELDLSACERVDLVDCALQGGSIRTGRFTTLTLHDCTLDDVDLSEARGIEAVRRSVLRGCRLVGTGFAGGLLEDVELTETVARYADLRMSTLRRVVFHRCELIEADLYEATLEDVDLDDSRLAEVSLDRVTATRVDLRRVTQLGLTSAADLRGCLISAAQAIEHAEAIALAAGILLPAVEGA